MRHLLTAECGPMLASARNHIRILPPLVISSFFPRIFILTPVIFFHEIGNSLSLPQRLPLPVVSGKQVQPPSEPRALQKLTTVPS